MSELGDRIARMITPPLEAMGYHLVRVRLMESGRSKMLQVMAERLDDRPMSLDDCENISHTASAILDVEDPIADRYQLEVSSPGLDRPLVTLQDYMRFKGRQIKLETRLPVDGRRRFQGRIAGVDASRIALALAAGNEMTLDFGEIDQARLIPSEDTGGKKRKGKK